MSERTKTVGTGLLLASLALVGCSDRNEAQAAESMRTMTSAQQASETTPLRVEVRYGAGELTITPADERMLYRMELRYDENNFRPLAEYDAQARRLRLGVTGEREGRRSVRMADGSTATIALGTASPTDLRLEFGAGRADIDLGGLSLERLRISTGASETRVRFDTPNRVEAERVDIEAGAADLRVTGLGNARARQISFQGGVGATVLDFSGEWSGETSASVQMGVGSLVLRIPRHLGVQLDRSSVLARFEPAGMVRQGNTYFSENWESAAERLRLNVNAAFGSIQIEWIDS